MYLMPSARQFCGEKDGQSLVRPARDRPHILLNDAALRLEDEVGLGLLVVGPVHLGRDCRTAACQLETQDLVHSRSPFALFGSPVATNDAHERDMYSPRKRSAIGAPSPR